MIVGIVAAKEHSRRFPSKNRYLLDGEPMFWHSVKPLMGSKHIEKVYVTTDSEFIKQYASERGVQVIWRPRNAAYDEDPLLNILRFAYYHLDKEYEVVATIMSNCPGHTVQAVDSAIRMMLNGDLMEIRSFNEAGEESGLMLFRKKVIREYTHISSHIGSIVSNAKQIHYKEDLGDRH